MSGDVEESQDSMPNSAKYIDTASIMAGPGEHGCPRCGGQVFHAEQMFSKGNIYHKVGDSQSYDYFSRYDSILVGSCFRNVSPATAVKGPSTPFCAAMVPTARFTARAAMQKHSGPKDTDLEAGLAFSCARTSKLIGWSDKP